MRLRSPDMHHFVERFRRSNFLGHCTCHVPRLAEVAYKPNQLMMGSVTESVRGGLPQTNNSILCYVDALIVSILCFIHATVSSERHHVFDLAAFARLRRCSDAFHMSKDGLFSLRF